MLKLQAVHVLMGLNLVLMGGLPIGNTAAREPAAPAVADVVRARAIEIVDENGAVRAQLQLGQDGGGLLRLSGGNGEVRVKLEGTTRGGGLLLLNKMTEPGVQLAADDKGASLTLTDADKRQRKIAP